MPIWECMVYDNFMIPRKNKTCCNHCCQQLAPVGLDINFGSSKSCVLKGLVLKERKLWKILAGPFCVAKRQSGACVPCPCVTDARL